MEVMAGELQAVARGEARRVILKCCVRFQKNDPCLALGCRALSSVLAGGSTAVS